MGSNPEYRPNQQPSPDQRAVFKDGVPDYWPRPEDLQVKGNFSVKLEDGTEIQARSYQEFMQKMRDHDPKMN